MSNNAIFARLSNLWTGFIALWVSDVEKAHPDIAYQNAINSMVEKYAKLKSTTGAIIARRQDITGRLEAKERELAGVAADLDAGSSPTVDIYFNETVLDAATALLIWGGQITVISSHNGKNNPFAQFCRDIEAGRYGADARVVTVTFDDAVANGLYERVCFMKGTPPTLEGKQAWYSKIRNGYGVRKAAMREELDAIPRDGNGVCLPGVWIEQAMTLPETCVLRLALDDDFVRNTPEQRTAWVADWIERNLAPALERLDKNARHVFSHDYARHRDFSIWGATALTTGMRREVPLVIEMHKVPYAQQKQITHHAIRHLPRRCGGAMDATGSGEPLAEETADKFGHSHVHQVKLNRAWYGTWMPKLVQGFEDGMIDIPADPNIAQDLRAIEEVDGIAMVAKARRADVKDPDLFRHGDGAVMLCLGWFATLNLSAVIDYIPVPGHSRGFDNKINSHADLDFPMPEPGGW